VFPVFDFGGASPCCLKIFRCLGFWRVWFSFCANFVLAAPDFFSTGFCVGHQISFCPVHLLAFPGFWRWFRSAQGAAYFPILLACDFLPSPIPCRSAARPLLAVLWSVSSLDFLAGPVLARDSFSAFSCRLDLSLRSRSQRARSVFSFPRVRCSVLLLSFLIRCRARWVFGPPPRCAAESCADLIWSPRPSAVCCYCSLSLLISCSWYLLPEPVRVQVSASSVLAAVFCSSCVLILAGGSRTHSRVAE
jgi:hypothetical protein